MGVTKVILLGMLTLTVSVSFALSDYSKKMNEMQLQFQDATELHKIVFMDKEQLQNRLDQFQGNASEYEAYRNQVMADFVEQNLGLNVDPISADTLGEYHEMSIAVAVPIEVGPLEQKVCAVFTANTGTEEGADAERLLYWEQMAEHTPEYEGQEIKNELSQKDFFELSLYHELFHCLDPYYIVKRDTYSYENEDTVHRAESYAEVGALLYLAAHEQKTSLAETRAMYRVVGSYMAGRYGDELIGMNLSNISFGVVYSFYPAIFAVQEMIETGLSKLSLKQIQQTAHAIVEEKAFGSEQSHAIRQHQRDPEQLEEMIEKLTKDNNDSLRERFLKIEKYRDEYLGVLDWAFAGIFGS